MATADPHYRPDDVRVEPPAPTTPPAATGPTWAQGTGPILGGIAVVTAGVNPVTGRTAKAIRNRVPVKERATVAPLTDGEKWAAGVISFVLTVAGLSLVRHGPKART